VTANGAAVPIDQAAACWLAAAGDFAYTANAGSGSIGHYAVAPDGTLTALGTTLVENDSASKPLDEGVSAGQNYLYVLAGGLTQIVGYRGRPRRVTHPGDYRSRRGGLGRRRRQLRADPRNLPCEAGNRFFPPPGQSSP
jgi:6-phosphogluconolactonase